MRLSVSQEVTQLVGGRGRPGVQVYVSFHSGHSQATEGSGSTGEEWWVVRDGFGVGPGPQLSYFCSVLSLRPFASLSRNSYGINGHPRPQWVR